MMEFITENQATWWFVLGCILLAIEIIVLGFSTAVLFFIGLGAIVTSGLMWFGILPATWAAGLTAFAVCSALVAAILWKPLKKLQTDRYRGPDLSSDFIGHEFQLDGDLSETVTSKTRYSGIEWRVELDDQAGEQSLVAGDNVVVTGISAGVFRVRQKEAN